MAKNGMIPAVVAGVIVAAVIIGGCEKKSDADAGAKQAPAASEAKPAPAPAEAQPAAPQPTPQAADAGAKPEAAPPAEAKPAEAPAPKSDAAMASATVSTPFDPANPYHRYDDGKWDFRTYRGYNMYHSICHVCHGANANGSSFAPALKESLKTLTYEDFVTVVMNGRVNITSSQTNVMPSFGENKTVVKYVDSLYAYLKARSTHDLGTEEVNWEGPKYEP